jgi:hypothetical protein
MKKSSQLSVCVVALLVVCFVVGNAGTIRSSGVKGAWSNTNTWATGVLPGPNDDVIIINNDSVAIDVDATVNNLTIGEGFAAKFYFVNSKAVKLTVKGNFFSDENTTIKGMSGATAAYLDTIFVYGDFIHNGAYLDFRTGSSPNYVVVCIAFLGPKSCTLKINGTHYESSGNELNSVQINKTDTAKIYLGSDIWFAGGSSTAPGQVNIHFINGLIVTGNYTLYSRSTTSATVNGGNAKSYVCGTFARGMSSSGGKTNEFVVGDLKGFRPIKCRSTTGGTNTGHYVSVKVVPANANTGSSTLLNEIGKVSSVRYYEIKYLNDTSLAATSMTFDKFQLGYGASDGVVAGSANLRAGYSIDNRASWTGFGQTTPDSTQFPITYPDYWQADSLPTGSQITLDIASGSALYLALARQTGSTDNSLDYTPSGIQRTSESPTTFSLNQNYPNPFNPSTTITFQLEKAGMTTLKIYDILGREIATLVNESLMAGGYKAKWNAASVSSGLYLYKLQSGNSVETRKMMFMK